MQHASCAVALKNEEGPWADDGSGEPACGCCKSMPRVPRSYFTGQESGKVFLFKSPYSYAKAQYVYLELRVTSHAKT